MRTQIFLKNTFLCLLTLGATTVFSQIKKDKTADKTTQKATRKMSTEQADSAAKPMKEVVIETRDGSKIQGKLLERRGDTIEIESATLGKVVLNIKNMKSIRDANAVVSPEKSPDEWFENPNASRYFLSSTGYGLRKGEGYYQNIYVFFNHLEYAFSDHFSVGGGFEAFSLFAGQAPAIAYVVPKFSIPVSKKFNIGVGVLLASLNDGGGRDFGALVHGVGTFGSRDNNFSFGLAFANGGGGWSPTPLIVLGGQTRVSRKFSLVGEFYTGASVIDFGGLFLGGARYMSPSFAFDFGFFGATFDGQFGAVPYVSAVIPFGRRKDKD